MVNGLEESARGKEPDYEKKVDFSDLTRRRLSHTGIRFREENGFFLFGVCFFFWGGGYNGFFLFFVFLLFFLKRIHNEGESLSKFRV